MATVVGKPAPASTPGYKFGLILFFVLLLAFAEVIGFTPAYLLASGAVAALLTFAALAAVMYFTRHVNWRIAAEGEERP